MSETKGRYFKVGKNASIFYDPKTGLKITSNNPGILEGKASKKVEEAVGNGHIVEIKEDEYNTLIAGTNDPHQDDESKFAKMSKKNILKYLKDTFDLTAEDKAEYKEMELEALRTKAEELEAAAVTADDEEDDQE